MTGQWGASQADWDTLAFLAGITDDILPFVADPAVPPADNTSWRPGAKMPSVVGRDGRGHGIKGWQDKITSVTDLQRFASHPAHGICIVTRRVRALDVDITDPVEADLVEQIIARHLGVLPTRRRGNSSKFLCAFMLEGEIPKRKVATRHGAVEFLATGQQFFAVGAHPSGERYTWDQGTPEDFPELTLAQLDAVWGEIVAQVGTEVSSEFTLGKTLIKQRMAVDINDEVVEFLSAEGWVKRVGSDGKVFIRCPFEGGHSKADSDDTATCYFPKGVGGFEQGHFLCQHQSCGHRTDGDYLEALGVVAAQFEVVDYQPEQGEVEAPEFKRNIETGKILSTPGNVMLALRSPQWLGVDIAFDDFRGERVITPQGRREWRAFRDADYMRLRLVLEGRGLTAGTELIREAVGLRADENRIDSAQLWLLNEVPVWDGVPRIDQFFPGYFGTEDSAYTRAVGAYTWTALAARVLDPGHKVDMVPILSSGEGCRKSESIAAMVPSREFFVELDLGDKDTELVRLMRGKLISELGEMKGLNKRQAGETKAFITRRVDEWTPKYQEYAVKMDRRLVFIGTTNETEMLSDNTGRRRWLPMAITRADTEAIERDRLQLWAEGAERFKANGRVEFEAAELLARDEHEKFEEQHAWDELIAAWLDEPASFENEGVTNRDKPFSTAQVLMGALHISASELGRKPHINTAASILKRLGFESRQIRVGGQKPRLWCKKLQVAASQVGE